MNSLELRYRKVLRLLPAEYRRVWADEMAATYLDRVAAEETADEEDADYLADYGRPAWSEVASVVALAVRLRLGAAGAPPRYVAWGAAIRLATLGALLGLSAVAIFDAAMMIWATGKLPMLAAPPEPWGQPVQGGWHLLPGFIPMLSVVAFVAAVFRDRVFAAAALGVLLASELYGTVRTAAGPYGGVSSDQLIFIGLLTLLLFGLAAFQRSVPRPARRPWLVAFAGGAVPVALTWFLVTTRSPDTLAVQWPGVACLAVAAVVLARLRRADESPAWPLALTMLAAASLAVWLAAYSDMVSARLLPQYPAWGPVALAEAGAALVAGLLMAVRAARALRRLSPEREPVAAP